MKINSTIKKFAKIFYDNNYQIYLVGGAVRDYLLGNKNFDYDFTTDAKPDAIIKMFRNVIPVGIEHGTVLVLFEDHEFEVTTFRSETGFSDNRHPDQVEFITSLNEDLERRDFTINAIAYDISSKKTIDIFEGKKDLKKKIIRTIGDPYKRFSEDYLRMIRACRFAGKLDFKIEDTTLNAIKELSGKINNISFERIRDELIKIMKTEKPSVSLEYLRITDLLKYVLPELAGCYGIKQNRFHKFDVYYHNLYTCDAAPKDNYIIRFAALFHDIAKPQTKKEKEEESNENSFYNHEILGARIANKVLKRLKFSNNDVKDISHLIKHHMFYYTEQWTDGAVRRFIKNVGIENLENLFNLREADRQGNGMKHGIPEAFLDFKERIKKILDADNAFKIKDLDINGNDLMKNLSIKAGPIIGEILNYLLELVLDNPDVNSKEILIEKAKEYYDKKSTFAKKQYGVSAEELGKF